eukprot:COSAG02_NODE_23906_length_704_cov_1.279339_1_plen_121_part_00
MVKTKAARVGAVSTVVYDRFRKTTWSLVKASRPRQDFAAVEATAVVTATVVGGPAAGLAVGTCICLSKCFLKWKLRTSRLEEKVLMDCEETAMRQRHEEASGSEEESGGGEPPSGACVIL